MRYIVSVSGGLGSTEALKRTIETHGKENVAAVFADVKGHGSSHYWSAAPVVDELLHERYGGESRDTYRFLWQIAYHFDIPIVRLEGLPSVWRVFADNRAFRVFAGGGFVHKCSELLKRGAIKKHIQVNYPNRDYEIVLGMGWDEQHRVEKAQAHWRRELGWDVNVTAPNTSAPIADNCSTERWLQAAGIELPASYIEGFEHNNCNGGCIAAGQAHFANLYKTRREIYLYWAYMEQAIQCYLGKFVTILKDERGGFAKPMSLYSFIPRIEVGDYAKLDYGGCGCFVGQPTLFELPPITT